MPANLLIHLKGHEYIEFVTGKFNLLQTGFSPLRSFRSETLQRASG